MIELLLGVGGALVVAALGWGYMRGRSSIESKNLRERLRAVKDKKEKDDEIDGLGHADLDERHRRWLRNE